MKNLQTYKSKKCERCNNPFDSTATSKYCIECKDIVRLERLRENNKKKKL